MKDLFERVLQRERVALADMLGEPSHLVPARLRFKQPELVFWRTDGGKRSEASDKIAAFYRSLGQGRLVILGQPGAGKSVLAMYLATDLVSVGLKDISTALLPVRMDVLTFNMTGYPHKLSAERVSAALLKWIRLTVATQLKITSRLADELVRQGRVLPILDGLDELDGDTSDPVRARELIRALNFPVRGELIPVVLTSRTRSYEALTEHVSAAEEKAMNKLLAAFPEPPYMTPEPTPLQNATVITIDPLEPKYVIDYLISRFPHPKNPRKVDLRWSGLITALGSVVDTPLKRVLAIPLNLFLITSAYVKPTSDPDELRKFKSAQELQEELFRKLIQVSVDRAREHRYYQRTWTLETVTRWLSRLAEDMTFFGPPEARFQVRIHAVWRLAGLNLPRYSVAALAALASILATIVEASNNGLSFALLALIALPIVAVMRLLSIEDTPPLRFNPRHVLTIPLRRFTFPACLAAGSVGLLLWGDEILRSTWRMFAIASVMFLALAGDHARIENKAGWLRGDDDTLELTWLRPLITQNPVRYVRSGALNMLILSSVTALMFALLGSSSISAALPMAFSIWLLMFSVTPWPRYFAAAPLLGLTGHFSARPARFLHWAKSAGFLAANGASLRFRHREFQAWLSKQRIAPDISTDLIVERRLT